MPTRQTETRTITEATIYWDSTDPNNEGWAARVKFSDGYEWTGCWEWTCDGSVTDLEEAVIALAHFNGQEIDTDSIICEPNASGGAYASWQAN